MKGPEKCEKYISNQCSFLFYVLSSCTLIGLGIGASIDASSADRLHFSLEEILIEQPSAAVLVITTEWDTMHSRIRNVGQVPEEDYTADYTYRRDQLRDDVNLPEIGDSITVSFHSSSAIRSGRFAGFSPGQIWMIYGTSRRPTHLRYVNQITYGMTAITANAL